MLESAARLHTSREFDIAMRSGHRSGRGAVVLHLWVPDESDPQRAGTARCGFVVSKAVGGSVVRHRVTRQLRHLCRVHRDLLPAGSFLVVRAQPSAGRVSFTTLTRDFRSALRRLGYAAEPHRVESSSSPR